MNFLKKESNCYFPLPQMLCIQRPSLLVDTGRQSLFVKKGEKRKTMSTTTLAKNDIRRGKKWRRGIMRPSEKRKGDVDSDDENMEKDEVKKEKRRKKKELKNA